MLAGNISSKSNLTQQDPSDLSTSQSLKTYNFRDETVHRDRMSQACGKTELLHKCFQLPPSFHLRWLHLESAELFCRVLFHPVIVKPKSAPNYCFPELPPCTRASSGPPHTSSFTMATLAEPFHPSCLKSSAGSLSITSIALSTWAFAPLGFPSPRVALQMPSYTLYNTCCGFPAYLSISRIRYTLENFCPWTVEIHTESSSQQGETATSIISVNGQRTGKVCEADKADTKHFTELLLTTDVSKVCVLCIIKLVFQSLINVVFLPF